MNDKHFRSMLISMSLLELLGNLNTDGPNDKRKPAAGITYTGDQLDAIKQEAFRDGRNKGEQAIASHLRFSMAMNQLADILIKSQGEKIDTLEKEIHVCRNVVAMRDDRIAELLRQIEVLENKFGEVSNELAEVKADNAALRGAAKIEEAFVPLNAGDYMQAEVERRLVGYMPADCADGKRYGEFISVLGFPPDTIPSPGEHGYERRAYYVSREQLFGENTAVDPICHRASKFVEPETSEELVPVILTILRG